MTADLVPLHGDAHQEVQELLPWYCTGHIDAIDRAKVEAHLTDCMICQAELPLERRLTREVAALPLQLELGWLELRGLVHVRATPWARLTAQLSRLWKNFSSGEHAGWVVAAQCSFLILLVSAISGSQRTGEYHALGTPSAGTSGNVIVMFTPDASEGKLRQVLLSAGARLVDGPTPAGAYVLFVDRDHRGAALARLRADPAILIAEPIAEGPSR